MAYGEEKARDMARSLLPSKNREAARQSRAHIHRSERRRARLETSRLAQAPEYFEDLAGLDEDSSHEIRKMVDLRRWGDKVAPFMRWASAHARALPRESRLGHIRALVPRGLIGDHALEHLEHHKDFEHPNETARREAWRLASAPSSRLLEGTAPSTSGSR